MHIHRTIFSTGSLLGLLVIFVYLYTVSTVFAADSSPTYVPLIGIPGVSTNSSLPDYINDIYKITIGVGAMFAVVRIALAGVKYSMSGVVTDKAEAKKDIKGVLLGLAILLLPALVLGTINPQILNLDVLKNVGSKVHMVPFTGTGKSSQTNNVNSVGSDGTISGDANGSTEAGATTFAVENCTFGGGDLTSGCAKTECDRLGGTLTEVYGEGGMSQYSRCTISGTFVDP